MDRKATDLMILHALAIQNTPIDPDEREKALAEYADHHRKCIELYGWDAATQALLYGYPLAGGP